MKTIRTTAEITNPINSKAHTIIDKILNESIDVYV